MTTINVYEEYIRAINDLDNLNYKYSRLAADISEEKREKMKDRINKCSSELTKAIQQMIEYNPFLEKANEQQTSMGRDFL